MLVPSGDHVGCFGNLRAPSEGTEVNHDAQSLVWASAIAILLALLYSLPVPAQTDGPNQFTLEVPLLTFPTPSQTPPEVHRRVGGGAGLVAEGHPEGDAPNPGMQRESTMRRDPMRQGSWEAGGFGAFMISGAYGTKIPAVVRAYWLLPRVGYTFAETPWYPGSFQVFLEPGVAYITHPARTYIVGASFILRHTLLAWSRFSPYVEGGAGLLNTNLRIKVLGESIEFMPQIGAGFHLHVMNRVSLNAGYRFHHISNAGLAERNRGINSHLPYAGFTYFF